MNLTDLPPEMIPITFADGPLAGQTVEADLHRCHSWRDKASGANYYRCAEAADGVLRYLFRRASEGWAFS